MGVGADKRLAGEESRERGKYGAAMRRERGNGGNELPPASPYESSTCQFPKKCFICALSGSYQYIALDQTIATQ